MKICFNRVWHLGFTLLALLSCSLLLGESFDGSSIKVCTTSPSVASIPENLNLSEQTAFFADNIFSTAYWPARWSCGQWTMFHGWLYIISDLVISICYFIIPAVLLLFIRKKSKLPFRNILFLFMVFILCCGVSHLLDAGLFWHPAYELSALSKFLTAVVSIITVIALIPVIPKLLSLKSIDNYKAEIKLRKKSEQKLELKIHELERINALTVDRELKMIELKEQLKKMMNAKNGHDGQ